jgi:phytoene dehydrogenase-like protein
VRTTYDAIVIGAGHNGLCLAAYLGRAGLSTLVVERSEAVGGMAATEEPLLPGFRHNPHANFLAYEDVMPVAGDFGLEALGLRTLMPDAQHGIAFSDGRPPIVLHRPGLLGRTHASVARHSASDADTYVELKRRAMTLEPQIAGVTYAPPTRAAFEAQAEAVAAAYGDLGITVGLAHRTGEALIDDLFESPEMRALMYRLAAELGVPTGEPGGALAFLGFVMWTTANRRLPVGGMRSVADALARACLREGVDVAADRAVDRVIVRDGRAVAIRLPGCGDIAAREVVASTAGLGHTLLGLLGERHLSDATVRAIRAFDATPEPTLASLMFCLREPPRYRSARWDPDIDHCFHTVVGFDRAEDAVAHMREVRAGLLPAPAAAVRVNTLWDPSQAPAGFHVAGADSFFPGRGTLSDRQWDDVRASYNDAFLGRWSQFAPNMTRRNVIADHFHLPAAFDRKVLLREGTEQYRTEVAGLYVAGTSTHPGGGIHGACGYNAYRAIAEDLGLVDRSVSISRMDSRFHYMAKNRT